MRLARALALALLAPLAMAQDEPRLVPDVSQENVEIRYSSRRGCCVRRILYPAAGRRSGLKCVVRKGARRIVLSENKRAAHLVLDGRFRRCPPSTPSSHGFRVVDDAPPRLRAASTYPALAGRRRSPKCFAASSRGYRLRSPPSPSEIPPASIIEACSTAPASPSGACAGRTYTADLRSATAVIAGAARGSERSWASTLRRDRRRWSRLRIVAWRGRCCWAGGERALPAPYGRLLPISLKPWDCLNGRPEEDRRDDLHNCSPA